MDSATWCRTPRAASAARRLRPEVSKNSSTALSSNEGELARSITTCALTMTSLRPSPVMVLTPLLGEAAKTSWPPRRRMATVFEPIRPVPPMTTIFMAYPPLSMTGDAYSNLDMTNSPYDLLPTEHLDTTRTNIVLLPAHWSRLQGRDQLTDHDSDRHVEQDADRTGVIHRGVLV